MEINAQTIPHESHNYDTCGNYWEDDKGTVHFRISELSSPDYEFLVLLHELIEEHLTAKKGLSIAEIDSFDLAFKGVGEPGEDPTCPYRDEHAFAGIIERLVADKLGVRWSDYEKEINALQWKTN